MTCGDPFYPFQRCLSLERGARAGCEQRGGRKNRATSADKFDVMTGGVPIGVMKYVIHHGSHPYFDDGELKGKLGRVDREELEGRERPISSQETLSASKHTSKRGHLSAKVTL